MRKLFFIKEAVHILLNVVMYTFLPILVVTLLTSKTNLIPGLSSFTVLTGSMEPLIPVGSIVYVYKSNSYGAGDIISFKVGKINVTHRIVGVVDEKGKEVSQLISPVLLNSKQQNIFYKTKGDANKSADSELVAANQVIGVTMFHIPYIGKFVNFLRSIPGFILFIIFPTFTFIGFELWNIKKEIEKETEKKVLERVGAYG